MSKQVIESFSPEDTFAFGVELGKKCKPGDILTLWRSWGWKNVIFKRTW